MNEIHTNNATLPPLETEVVVDPATPGSRIAAYLINVVFTLIAYIPLMVMISSSFNDLPAHRADLSNIGEAFSWTWLIGFLILLVYALLQIRIMSRDGQSFGKKIMKIRLLTTDGTNPGFRGAVLMREIVFNIALTAAASLIGRMLGTGSTAGDIANLVSLLVWLICFIMLFNRSKNRRTLQDYFAKTVVVKLPGK
ncbi:RDD family protein [Neisseria zalophi]|uniref:RDD family protein n=1 Tax=Neisseria zalophi TaxID=640030 RepID=A0A5J6PRV8_9NEIS|nr:RDD family protein [Neisseria zalophi]QEY25215.1 RDD family protein [Neisseria zalophi]